MHSGMKIGWKMNFLLRIVVFIIIFITYLSHRDLLESLLSAFNSETLHFTPLYLLWILFECIMISHLFPSRRKTLALRKEYEEEYVENPYDELELLHFVQNMNVKAWKVMLVWLSGNAFVGLAYLLHLLQTVDLLMLCVFYFSCDYICILIFCPFQKFTMNNRCCINCRIYDWGHFMMFTPMLFIQNFFSWTLFFTSVIVLIHWEFQYAKNPERFWHKSNRRLKCENCKEHMCAYKRKLRTHPKNPI